MDIKQLQYFVSVAEQLNFTKAAQQHFIAQTAISQQIMALEKSLGVVLFTRNKRVVKLTPAGEVFYREVKSILSNLDLAINKTQSIYKGYTGTLDIGFLELHQPSFFPKFINEYNCRYPNVNLNLSSGSNNDLREALQNRKADIIITLAASISELPDIEWMLIDKEPLCAIVYPGHPLDGRKEVPRSELCNERFIDLDRDGPRDLYSDSIKCGFKPNIVRQVNSIQVALVSVESKIGIACLDKTLKRFARNLTFINLLDNDGNVEYIEYAVAWRKGSENQCISPFLELLKEQIQE